MRLTFAHASSQLSRLLLHPLVRFPAIPAKVPGSLRLTQGWKYLHFPYYFAQVPGWTVGGASFRVSLDTTHVSGCYGTSVPIGSALAAALFVPVVSYPTSSSRLQLPVLVISRRPPFGRPTPTCDSLPSSLSGIYPAFPSRVLHVALLPSA